jgi:hypothetical protein
VAWQPVAGLRATLRPRVVTARPATATSSPTHQTSPALRKRGLLLVVSFVSKTACEVAQRSAFPLSLLGIQGVGMFRFEHVMPHAFGVMWPNANSPQFTPPSPSPRRYLVGFGSGGMLHGTAREGARTVALSAFRNSRRETASHESNCLEAGIRRGRIGAILDGYADRTRSMACLISPPLR